LNILGASGKSSIDSIMALIEDFVFGGRALVYHQIAKTIFAIVWAKVPSRYSKI
jgi:hypothetical protein